jgi:transcriptional regulator with XRE-family HTH domain
MSNKNIDIVKNDIGMRLKEIRMHLGLSQSSMANMLNTSASYISDIEKGKAQISINILIALYKHYSVDPLWILTGEERPAGEGISENKELIDARKRIKKLEAQIEVLKDMLVEERKKHSELSDKERNLKRSDINIPKLIERE